MKVSSNAFAAHINDIIMPPDGDGIVMMKLPAKEKEATNANE